MEGRASGKAIRRGIVTAVVLAVAALVLPPFINIGRYKSRVIDSMSKALGRPVTCDSVELRLLPQPGFYLANVVIGDDPAYSLEPILHAEEVNAYLGVSSLWRGRLEIARLNLNYPSLNLVERERWQLEPRIAFVEGRAHPGRAHLDPPLHLASPLSPTFRRRMGASISNMA